MGLIGLRLHSHTHSPSWEIQQNSMMALACNFCAFQRGSGCSWLDGSRPRSQTRSHGNAMHDDCDLIKVRGDREGRVNRVRRER